MFYPWITMINYPKIPNDYDIPPTIYSLLYSYVNYGNEETVRTSDLARAGRGMIFDFSYPLSDNVKKEDFETLILNHFMMRRIGYETLTAFKIALSAKLNEIMPNYNILFNAVEGWDLFNDGEVVTRTEERASNGSTESNSSATINVNSNVNSTSDNRNSDTPQNNIDDIKNGNYVSDYSYNTDNSTSSSESANKSTDSTNTNDISNVTEKITRTPNDKLALYKEFIESKKNIYTMIFNDLEPLFYGLL